MYDRLYTKQNIYYIYERKLWAETWESGYKTEIDRSRTDFIMSCWFLDNTVGFSIAVADGFVEVLLHPECSEAHLWVVVPALSNHLGHWPKHLHQRTRQLEETVQTLLKLYLTQSGCVRGSIGLHMHVWEDRGHPVAHVCNSAVRCWLVYKVLRH